MERYYEVVVDRRVRTTYVVKATDIESAEESALDGTDSYVSEKVDVQDEHVHDSRDVTENSRDHDAENDRDRDEAQS